MGNIRTAYGMAERKSNMVGYISVNMEELKIKEYREYRGWYCGLCRELSKNGGICARLTLSYDMTFLYMLLSSLYDEKVKRTQCRCPVHPLIKHLSCETALGNYIADMGILLGYYDLKDDWADEKKFYGRVLSAALRKRIKEIAQKYPRKYNAVKNYVKRLHKYEKKNTNRKNGIESLDIAAGYTGEMLGELFVYKNDIWEMSLRRMGFYLGKFIYLLDAWEDIEKDCQIGNYNPFFGIYKEKINADPEKGKKEFHTFAIQLLEKMAAECCRAFETLPIIDNVEILRNILYSGIWAHKEKEGCRSHLEML